jgi:hypothetical protein
MLTAERLRDLLIYNPETGLFSRRVGKARARAGAVCGDLDSHGYVRISLDCKRYLGHRLAWLYVHGCWPAADIDHINGVRTDNRLANLREAARRNNLANRRGHASSGLKGAYWHGQNGCWYSRIGVNGKSIHLGCFDTAEEANAAYLAAARKHFGEFARA